MSKIVKALATAVPLVFLVANSFAQNGKITVKGKIVESTTGTPVAGATIETNNKNKATTSNDDGSFILIVDDNIRNINITAVGYENYYLKLRNSSEYSIQLVSENSKLDDVIVTGYSTQNKKFISGSIVNISGNELKEIPSSNFTQLLQGKASGVQVSANSGVPGGGITFRVRGNNSINAAVEPLYIIDGVFINSNNNVQTGMGGQTQSSPLADISPSDIEDITILKDANATAIYGSLGANGVVIVNTKKGKLNSKGKISFNISQGRSEALKKFEHITGEETGILVNEAAINTAKDNGIDPGTITLPFPDPSILPTYDRNSGLFRNAKSANYELNIRGGSDKSTYYIGLGYNNEESVVKPSGFERITARINYDSYVTKNIKIGTNTNFSRTYRNVSSNDNNPTGVINSAIFPRSYVPIFNADGTYNRAGSFDNHLALINNLDNNAVGWRTISNLFAEISIIPGLKFKSSFNIDNNDMFENNYSNTLIVAGIAAKGSATSIANKALYLTNEQVLTYVKRINGKHTHDINALVGNTFNTVKIQNTNATGQGFATNNIKAISDAATRSGSSSRSEANLISYFAKASYTLDNKYTLDASIRADASSKFGVDNRWGYFPSAGFTWRASEEKFIQNLNIFDELKFRGSIGLSGNQNGIGPYAALGLWSSGYNYLETAGTAPTQLENRNLTWETTRQADIGVEFSILKKLLHFNIDFYNKYTYDLLLQVPTPSPTGFTSYLQNYGAVRNKGVEIAVTSNNVNTNDFSWTTTFNISFNRNKIEKLASDIALGASGRNVSILREGYAVNSFQLYKQLYVDPQTGNAVYEDVNKDGGITAADRQIVGNANPKYFGGLTNNITYKNFNLNFFLYFQQGNKIMNMRDFFLVHGGTQNFIGFIPRQLDRWQQPGDVTDIPRLTTYRGNINENGGAANNYGGQVASLSSRYLEDGSFLRLRNVSLSYNVPKSVYQALKIENIRAYVQASNLFTVTNYKGLDPEVSAQSSNQNTAGYDWATVPQPRTILVGLNVTF